MFACAPLRHRRAGDRYVSAKCITMRRTLNTRLQTLVNNTSCICTFSLSAFSCLKKKFYTLFHAILSTMRDADSLNHIPNRKVTPRPAGSCFRVVDNKRLHDTTDCQRSCAIDRIISHIISRAWPRFTKGIKILRKKFHRNSYDIKTLLLFN